MSIPQKSPKQKTQGAHPSRMTSPKRVLPFSDNATKFYPFLKHASNRLFAVEGAAGFLQDQRYDRHRKHANQAAMMIEVVSQLIDTAISSATAPGESNALEEAQRFLGEADDALTNAMTIWSDHEGPCHEAEAAVQEFVAVMGQLGMKPN